MITKLPELLQDTQIGPSLDLLPSEILHKVLSLLPTQLDYYLISKRFYELISLYHKKIYLERVLPMTGLDSVLEMKELGISWGRICCLALACLYQNEWDLGAPRLFYIKQSQGSNDLTVIRSIQSQHPNPEDTEWKCIFGCTMDMAGFFEKNTLADAGLLLRYSERMDIGTFLLYVNLPNGPHLFRCKPIGTQTSAIKHSGKIILWDAATFGTCSFCSKKLTRLQVCSDCRVSQYCSRNCQHKDWERHKQECKKYAFVPYFPVVPSEDEEML